MDSADSTFVFQINYNETDDSYSIDLYDMDMDPIVLGRKIIKCTRYGMTL
ncbi:hypothetical protein ACEQPO_08130 [Bacillus sp. SL00103]